jgi:hypothetical protein
MNIAFFIYTMAQIVEYIHKLEQKLPKLALASATERHAEQKNAFYILRLYLDFSTLPKPIIDKIIEIFECYLAQKLYQTTQLSGDELNSQIGLGKPANKNLVASIFDGQSVILLPFCNQHTKMIFGFDCISLLPVLPRPLVTYDGYLYDNESLDERAKVINPRILHNSKKSAFLNWFCTSTDALCDRCGNSTYIIKKSRYIAIERLCIQCHNQFVKNSKCDKCNKKRYNHYSFLARSCLGHGGKFEKKHYSKEVRALM